MAALRNPTVRTRYLAARETLADLGHIDAVAEAFDLASAVVRTPVFYATDISLAARPIAIDGGRELIDRGDHREAVFWIVATACRCQMILAADAPAEAARFAPAFRGLLADLGVTSVADLQRRRAETVALVPAVWSVAEAIMAANPAIVDG